MLVCFLLFFQEGYFNSFAYQHGHCHYINKVSESSRRGSFLFHKILHQQQTTLNAVHETNYCRGLVRSSVNNLLSNNSAAIPFVIPNDKPANGRVGPAPCQPQSAILKPLLLQMSETSAKQRFGKLLNKRNHCKDQIMDIEKVLKFIPYMTVRVFQKVPATRDLFS